MFGDSNPAIRHSSCEKVEKEQANEAFPALRKLIGLRCAASTLILRLQLLRGELKYGLRVLQLKWSLLSRQRYPLMFPTKENVNAPVSAMFVRALLRNASLLLEAAFSFSQVELAVEPVARR